MKKDPGKKRDVKADWQALLAASMLQDYQVKVNTAGTGDAKDNWKRLRQASAIYQRVPSFDIPEEDLEPEISTKSTWRDKIQSGLVLLVCTSLQMLFSVPDGIIGLVVIELTSYFPFASDAMISFAASSQFIVSLISCKYVILLSIFQCFYHYHCSWLFQLYIQPHVYEFKLYWKLPNRRSCRF